MNCCAEALPELINNAVATMGMKGRALLNVQEYPEYSKGNIADVNCRTILFRNPESLSGRGLHCRKNEPGRNDRKYLNINK